SDAGDLCGLLYSQPGFGSELVARRKTYAQDTGFGVEFERIKSSGVESKPKSIRRQVDSGTSGIERRDFDHSAGRRHVAAETDPSELWMVHNIRRGIPSVAKEIRTVIARKRIGLQHVGKRMKRCRGKTLLINISECSHGAAVTNA